MNIKWIEEIEKELKKVKKEYKKTKKKLGFIYIENTEPKYKVFQFETEKFKIKITRK
jgi:hypothetical protein